MNRLNSLLAMLLAVTSANPSLAETEFAHEVVPILKEHCVECHGGREAKGGFSVNTRALFLENEAAIPGEPGDSLFLHLVQEADKDLQMPPDGKHLGTTAKSPDHPITSGLRESKSSD